VARDLQRSPKQLQPQYLYDALGSRLFEAICQLPWYSIARVEGSLLARHTTQIASRLLAGDEKLSIIELGVGSGEKIATLIRALPATINAAVHLIDISPAALAATTARLAAFPFVSVVHHLDTYERGLQAASAAAGEGRKLVLFLGSNIGNFEIPAARRLLRAMRDAIEPGDLLLLGADLVKPAADLLLAYDDPLGVTAAFNKNLLVRINRELQGTFDIQTFDHRAVWNGSEQRIEMHLVSRIDQDVTIPLAGVRITFTAGETIWTESSYKYSEAGVADLAAQSGFSIAEQWIDERARFALTLLTAC
jgi:dimethylhistidine N-methyltransferase